MLIDYTIYRKLEEQIDAKYKSVRRENFSNVWKAVLPVVITYLNFQLKSSLEKHLLIAILLLLFLLTFKKVRQFFTSPAKEMYKSLSFEVGVSKKELTLKELKGSFDIKYLVIKQELLFLHSLFGAEFQEKATIIKIDERFNLMLGLIEKDITSIARYLRKVKKTINSNDRQNPVIETVFDRHQELQNMFIKFVDSLESLRAFLESDDKLKIFIFHKKKIIKEENS